jgi:hypothetical protein
VKCEKQQVGAIVQYLRKVLHDLPPAEDKALPGSLELVEPVEQAFVLGPIGLGYDRQADRLVVQLEEMGWSTTTATSCRATTATSGST